MKIHERETVHTPAVHLLSLEDLSLKDCHLATQVFDVAIFHIFSNILRGRRGTRYTWKEMIKSDNSISEEGGLFGKHIIPSYYVRKTSEKYSKGKGRTLFHNHENNIMAPIL